MKILKIANAIKDSLTLQMQRQSVAILRVATYGEMGVLSARPNWLLSKSELYHMVKKIVIKSSFIILV